MNIVILSRNPALYSTQSLYMAAKRKGHDVRVIDHMRCELGIEAGRLEVFYEGLKIHNVDAIIPRIGASATSYGAAVVRQFEMMKVFTAVQSEALLKSRDKRTAMQYLAAHGVNVPYSMITNNVHSLRSAIERIGPPPVIVKLLSSTQGLGVILGETMNSTESIMEAFLKMRQKVILQEFIEESNGSDIRIFIVDGKIVAAMERKAKEGEFRSNLHRGASSQRVYLTDKERNVALQCSKILRLKVAGVDLLRSNRGPLVLEVNASPGLEGIETTTRIDVAGRIIEYIERNARKKWY